MKKVLLMGIILLTALYVKSAQQDTKAKEILDKVSEKTRSFSTLSADFSFTMKNEEMEIDEKNEGTIKFKGKKYSVDIKDLGFKIFSDGNTVWNYMEDGNQVTISTLEDSGNDLMDPTSLFNIYERGFQSKFLGEEKENGKDVYKIELLPDSDEYDVSKIIVSIDKNTMMIQSAVLYGTDENLYGITINKLVTNKDYADSEFVFDESKFGDVEVIDLR